MPRKNNPGDIKTGAGRKSPPNTVLTGATGAPPNVGEAAWLPPGGVLADAQPLSQEVRYSLGGSGQTAAIYSHDSSQAAHAAKAITQDDGSGPLTSGNVQGALNELGGILPPEPPRIGQHVSYMAFSGVPDWGVLKLNDSSLVERGLLTSENDPSEIFPYYYQAPSPAIDSVFDPVGQDPHSDPIWNSGLDPDTELVGAGPGQTYAGGFTRDGSSTGQDVIKTARIMLRSSDIDGDTGLPIRQEVTISGTVYPADRGVLALLHWPPVSPGSIPSVADFMNQDLLDRCVAALVLGQGLFSLPGSGGNCLTGDCSTAVCDGSPGGIFAVGAEDGEYNPYAYPGRATGQYDLDEIHTGLSGIDGTALRAPFDDFDGDGSPGAQRAQYGTTPAPGQVRLGTVELAGEGVLEYGIPILGATLNAYDQANPPTDLVNGEVVIGNSMILDSNFFRYRLPYLSDYTPEGLKWTPSGVDPLTTKEKARYFEVAQPAVATYNGEPLTTLPTAGLYQGFHLDYWAWQVARYRHTFVMPSTTADGLREEVGSYWLVHFKTEADFEACVRDGVMPWDIDKGYEVYSAALVDRAVEAEGNYANQETLTTVPAPRGPAPDYGYQAEPYHLLRGAILLDPNALVMPTGTAEYQWQSVAGVDGVMWVSGVAYYTARNTTDGTANFEITSLSITTDAPHGFWNAGYRTDDSTLTNDTTAPALMSSPCPAFISIAAFAWDENPSSAGQPTLDVDMGAAGVALTDSAGARVRRIEIPYTHCGSNAGGVFGPSNGPQDTDEVFIASGAPMAALGDVDNPSFAGNAVLRAFFRRPVGHGRVEDAAMPFAASSGHGIIIAPDDGAQILYHSTKFDVVNQEGQYGNFRTAGVVPQPGYSVLFNGDKDVAERFLDETYRIRPDFGAGQAPMTSLALRAMTGPGMGGWTGAAIEVPVRMGIAAPPWDAVSWLQNDLHLEDLVSGADPVKDGLQVAGLPDRNPPLSDGSKYPFPSNGILLYPQKNYTLAPIRPEEVADALTQAQPDYTAATGTRSYIRAFDASFRDSGDPVVADGASTVLLRFDGITLEDFAYTAPGPGRLEDGALAIMVKVPGRTTWMDAGRSDGAGPSKQDDLLDGAGCMVVGPETFNGVDSETGIVYCQVKVHVGPVATLFKNTGALGVQKDEVPVLVKVLMTEDARDYSFEKEYTGGAFGVSKVGASNANVRGLIGIRVVRPS